MSTQPQKEIAFNPSAIVHIFNNALNIDATRKMICVTGMYLQGKGGSYNGFYYDALKDEYTDASITLLVPALLRSSLVHQQIIECTGYITKKVQPIGARIELQFTVTELLSQEKTKVTDEALESLTLLQQKARSGYKDIDSFIKKRIVQEEMVKVTIIIGKSAIIDSDIKHQLKEAIAFYEFIFIRCNLSNETEIIEAMEHYSEVTDILVIARGGGDNLAIFNRSTIVKAALNVHCFFMTAIGHKEDTPLLEKVADKSFITPTALGQYFNDIYNQTIEELHASKGKLADDIKKQYEYHVEHLKEENRLIQQKYFTAQNTSEYLQRKMDKDQKPAWIWSYVVIALVVGILLERGCDL